MPGIVRWGRATPSGAPLGAAAEARRLEVSLLDVLERLVETAYSRDKRAALKMANLRLAVARPLWRLTHELQAISTRPYAHGAELMDDLGRQVGGWLHNSREG
jgi:hypothetical protein